MVSRILTVGGCALFTWLGALFTWLGALFTWLGALFIWLGLVSFAAAQPAAQPFDVILRAGWVVDGTGQPRRQADVGLRGDRIAAVGDLSQAKTRESIDCAGLVVAPGFINMLSWATTSLLEDGRAESDVRQGVTLEVFGEGWSFGPLNAAMKRDLIANQGDIKFKIPWTSLSQYLQHLQERGVNPNVASFVGATTVRIHVLGYDDRQATEDELAAMRDLVRSEMEQGALGIGSSLIYAPAVYADTKELIELCKVAAAYDGMYISHLRSEGNRLLEAVDEFLKIAREADIDAEIYHLKAAGRENWPKLAAVIQKIEQARAAGLGVSANMYPYTAGATGLNAAMPPWVQEGGFKRWRERLQDPRVRQRVIQEMRSDTETWENLLRMAGSADQVLLVGFKNPALKHLTGQSLAAVARQRKRSPEETAMDLVVEDNSRVECVYFLMSEENVRAKLQLPWVSFGSDAAAPAARDVFLKSNPHPRAYGSFARVLGNYSRDKKVLTLEQAVHRLAGWPARRLGLRDRGTLAVGNYADVAVFDPAEIRDPATYDQPHQYAEGMRHVLINGVFSLRDNQLTGNLPGRVVRGPGYYRRDDHRTTVELTPQAVAVHQRGYVFDGHNDLPWTLRENASSSFARRDISQHQPKMHTDIPRLRQGNVGAQFWSVFVPADTRGRGESLVQTIEQIELVHAMVRRYPETFGLALTSEDVRRIRGERRIASLIGMEGGHSIENSLANLRRLYQMGARYMTLTHSQSLDWADSATDEARHAGLTPFGEEVVREMNRLGMLVDLSHVSPATMKDALRVTRAPVIFSHSSARAIADHARNVPDDVLRLTAQNGGVVMVNFFSGFVEPTSAQRMSTMFADLRSLREQNPSEDEYDAALTRWRTRNPLLPGTIHDLVDHIDHIVRVAGVEHVGLGSDYDGVSMLPRQLEDVSTYPLITQEMLNRGYTEGQIHQVMFGNVLRVLEQAERVAAELRQGEGDSNRP